MTLLTGGCQCGGIRYEVDSADIKTLYCCHCLECQRQSSSAFGMSAVIPEEKFRITKGAVAVWERDTDRGTKNRGHFCPDCGVRIYHRPTNRGGIISLKAGTLDNRGNLDPIGHIWFKRAQPWIEPRDSDIIIDGQPAEYERLFAAWAEREGG